MKSSPQEIDIARWTFFRTTTTPDILGVTPDATGANLPVEHAPWRSVPDAGDALSTALARHAAIGAIETQGYCVGRQSVTGETIQIPIGPLRRG